MALSAPNSTVLPPQIHLTPPSVLSSFTIDATKFSFYQLSVAGFLILVISGLVLIRTQYALRAIAEKTTTYLTSTTENLSSTQTMTLNMLSMTATWKLPPFCNELEALPLFGPLPSVIPMTTVPVSAPQQRHRRTTHLSSVSISDVENLARVTLGW